MNFKKLICLIFTGQDKELCREWERKGTVQRERKRKGEEKKEGLQHRQREGGGKK